LDKNRERDKVSINNLKELGWDILVVYTCEVNDTFILKNKLLSFFESYEEKNRT